MGSLARGGGTLTTHGGVRRAATLAANGHPVDKIELLVLGGTWASYPHAYQEAFCRDLFYAANTFYERGKRARLSLAEEQRLNEAAVCKIIGLTLETRPDTITPEELRRLRRYGCTRVQLGIQHTSDAVLKRINRGCTTADAAAALRMLKDCCYKIDIHLMPNLPGASPAADRAMFDLVLHSPALQADQWKLYPCEVTPWTIIKKWFDEGSFVPYDHAVLVEVLLDVKSRVHPWIRLNRVIRDIPSQYIFNESLPNLREDLAGMLHRRGQRCACIRCREVGGQAGKAVGAAELVERRYAASGGREVFLSYETADRHTIFGFLRLRLSPQPGAGVFGALRGAALVRELHVYGQLIPTSDGSSTAAQHVGFGRQLMARAESIASAAGFTSVAVIAGVGSRNYYRKLGYELEPEGGFMLKALPLASSAARIGHAVSRVADAATEGVSSARRSCSRHPRAAAAAALALGSGIVIVTVHSVGGRSGGGSAGFGAAGELGRTA